MKFQVSVNLVFYSLFSGTLNMWMTEAQSQTEPDRHVTVINFIESDHSFFSNGIYYLRSDENLVMNCSSDADPVVKQCKWSFCEGDTYRRDIVPVGDTNNHCSFNQTVNVKFTGVYCQATNEVVAPWSSKAAFTVVPTTRSVKFNIPGNPNPPANPLYIEQGENQRLNCSVDYGTLLDTAYQWEGPNGFPLNNPLPLSQLRSSDTGNYTCRATDQFGNFFQRNVYIRWVPS